MNKKVKARQVTKVEKLVIAKNAGKISAEELTVKINEVSLVLRTVGAVKSMAHNLGWKLEVKA